MILTVDVGLSKISMLGRHEVTHKMLAERGASPVQHTTAIDNGPTMSLEGSTLPWCHMNHSEKSRAKPCCDRRAEPQGLSQAYEPVYNYQSKFLLGSHNLEVVDSRCSNGDNPATWHFFDYIQSLSASHQPAKHWTDRLAPASDYNKHRVAALRIFDVVT